MRYEEREELLTGGNSTRRLGQIFFDEKETQARAHLCDLTVLVL